jgi:hypothetical protein
MGNFLLAPRYRQTKADVGRRMGDLSPLARSLDARLVAPFTLGNHYQNLAPQARTGTVSSTYSGGVKGAALFPSGTTEQIHFGTEGELGLVADHITMVIRARWDNFDNGQQSLQLGSDANSVSVRMGLGWPYSGTVFWDYGDLNNAGRRASTARTNVPDGSETSTYVFVAGPQGLRVWIDGQTPSGINTTLSAVRAVQTSNSFNLGDYANGGNRNGNTRPESLWVFNEAVSDVIAKRISENPYRELVAPERRFFIVPASVVATDSLGIASENDAAQTLAATLSAAVGIASENDAAQTLAATLSAAVGIASENDAAQALAATLSAAVGIASENDAAQALAATLSAAVGIASENDAAQTLAATLSAAVGIASENDAAQTLAATLSAAVGIASENDAAQTLASPGQLSAASELDTAQALSATLSAAVGIASENDAAQTLSSSASTLIGTASELDAAQTLGATLSAPVGIASENNAALPLSSSVVQALAAAVENNAALTLSGSIVLAIGTASELDAARGLHQGAIGVASELDGARALLSPGLAATASSLEYSLAVGRLHYAIDNSRLHYKLEE